MQLFTTTIESYRSQPGEPLAEGSVEDIVKFLCQPTMGFSLGIDIGKFEASDLKENGGNWGCPPEDWSEDAPYYFSYGDRSPKAGFETLEEALRGYAARAENVLLND